MNLRQDIKTVHVGIALDESGSMMATKKETINGLNEHIQEYKKFSDINTSLTLVKFSGKDNITTLFNVKPIKEINSITNEDYNPDGITAMYDGVGMLFNTMKQNIIDDENTTYIILIISDGQENCSIKYNSQKISEMITERLNTKRWTINYIGANQNLSIVKQNLNLAGGSSLNYSADRNGTNYMWHNINTASVKYMNTRTSTDNSDIKFASLDKGFFSNE